MARIKLSALSLAIFYLAGCGKNQEQSAAPAGSVFESRAEIRGPSPALAGVNDSLKAGAYDDAAARLLELQASGRTFTQREAADYRKALNEAYTRALEAAEKGDTRAEAAIKMIRASGAQ